MLVGNMLCGMKKATSSAAARGKTIKSKKSAATKATLGQPVKASKKAAPAAAGLSLRERIAEAKKLEALDRAKAPSAPGKATQSRAKQLTSAGAVAATPSRNGDFPNTSIEQISVRLDDPDHSVTLTWTRAAGGCAGGRTVSQFAGCRSKGTQLQRPCDEPPLWQQMHTERNLRGVRVPRPFEQ
jgi:hypothetical protein